MHELPKGHCKGLIEPVVQAIEAIIDILVMGEREGFP